MKNNGLIKTVQHSNDTYTCNAKNINKTINASCSLNQREIHNKLHMHYAFHKYQSFFKQSF